MENETLKQLVLAKGKEVAPILSRHYVVANGVEFVHQDNQFVFYTIRADGKHRLFCNVLFFMPANDPNWWIAAKILDIPTEMSIDEFELSMAIRQHYNDMQDAHDAGFDNFHGITMTKEQSWEAFIGDYGKEEMKQPVPIFDSQLRELCVALGWQGGTYHQVLAEVKRLKAFADEKRTESHC